MCSEHRKAFNEYSFIRFVSQVCLAEGLLPHATYRLLGKEVCVYQF
jgi:hypothetical protein